MSKKKIEAARRYNETAEMYDRRYKTIQFSKYREVFSEMEILETDLILDIGGGTGLLIEFLENKQESIINCDLSFEMLREGKSKFPFGNFVCADSEYLPFRNSCSGIICYFSIFQNLNSPHQSLKEGSRVLQKDGRFVITALSKIFDIQKISELIENVNLSIKKSWNLPLEDLAVLGKKKEN